MWISYLLFIAFSGNVYCEDNPKCYDELGCFPNDYPWTGPLRPLFPAPEDPEEINTKIYCYARDSPTERYNVTLRPAISLEGCPFRANRATMFVTHGFFNSGKLPWLTDLKDNYLEATDANVFIVDWAKGAKMLNYLEAASDTRIVGAEIARFIRYLQRMHNLNPADLHLIGHSLGAHVMSYAANNISGTQRITGMDPAQPGFEGSDEIVRLDKSDANFVDIIHTNGIPVLGLGYVSPNGHVDFYLNGGKIQPVCRASDLLTEFKNMQDLAEFSVEAINSLAACSHIRAYKYFTDALLPNCTLWGHRTTLSSTILTTATLGLSEVITEDTKKCDADSCIPLGLETPKYKARGIFSVSTPLVAPFCDDPETNIRIISEISETLSGETQRTTETAKTEVKRMANNIENRVSDITNNIVNSAQGFMNRVEKFSF